MGRDDRALSCLLSTLGRSSIALFVSYVRVERESAFDCMREADGLRARDAARVLSSSPKGAHVSCKVASRRFSSPNVKIE